MFRTPVPSKPLFSVAANERTRDALALPVAPANAGNRWSCRTTAHSLCADAGRAVMGCTPGCATAPFMAAAGEERVPPRIATIGWWWTCDGVGHCRADRTRTGIASNLLA